MNKLKKTSLALATASGVLLLTFSPASAFAGGEHMGMHREEMSAEDRLVTPEIRARFRDRRENLSEKVRAEFREKHRAQREENRREMESFSGMTRDEIRSARQSGQSMGDILSSRGKSEADVKAFLSKQANEHIDMMAEHHNLTAEQKTTLQNRINAFVQSMLARWFHK